MSSSDYISKKKYKHMSNNFTTKDSGNETAKKKINIIRNIKNTDIFGDPISSTWFGVGLPTNEIKQSPNAQINSLVHTSPLFTKTPEMTIEPALKNIIPYNICGSCFPSYKDVYLGGPLIEGKYKFIACNQCGGNNMYCKNPIP
jgi:hypothetical protein